MSELVKLEKRFENAFEKLELALANKKLQRGPTLNSYKEVKKDPDHNISDLLGKIEQLERFAKNDAREIDKLVEKLKEIIETDND